MDEMFERMRTIAAANTSRRPRIVIVGAGFGVLTAAMCLRRTN